MSFEEIQSAISRYLNLYPPDPTPSEVIEQVEHRLSVVLPNDLKEIGHYYRGGIIGSLGHLEIGFGPADNIVDETEKARRALQLPTRFLVLVKADTSMVFMETEADPEKPTLIYWVDNEDAYSFGEGVPQRYNSTMFANYTEFFIYLLKDEQTSREDEEASSELDS